MKIKQSQEIDQRLRELKQKTDQHMLDLISKKSAAKPIGLENSGAEKVDVSLSSQIRQELDVNKIAEERRAKIESIKERIAANSYYVSTPELSDKVTSNLDAEVADIRRIVGEDS